MIAEFFQTTISSLPCLPKECFISVHHVRGMVISKYTAFSSGVIGDDVGFMVGEFIQEVEAHRGINGRHDPNTPQYLYAPQSTAASNSLTEPHVLQFEHSHVKNQYSRALDRAIPHFLA